MVKKKIVDVVNKIQIMLSIFFLLDFFLNSEEAHSLSAYIYIMYNWCLQMG